MARPDPRDVKMAYDEAKSIRLPYEQDWRSAVAYCLPGHYAAWQSPDTPYTVVSASGQRAQAARQYAYDMTGILALPKFTAVVHRLLTPDGIKWTTLEPTNNELKKSTAVRRYFGELNDKLFRMRYNSRARFVQTKGEAYRSLGVYGNGPQSLVWAKDNGSGQPGFSYKALPMRDCFVIEDDNGNVCGMFRRLHLNARKIKMKFRKVYENGGLPKAISAELDKATPSETRYFEIVHYVMLRDDYDPNSIHVNRMRYTANYLFVESAEWIGEEEGFISMPYVFPRAGTDAGELYGYSPAMQALPALGGLSAMKKTVLKQGHKAVDPPTLYNDDGVLGNRIDIRPGAGIPGGVNAQGQQLVRPYESGSNFRVAENLLEGERDDIRDSFMAKLFDILLETPEMTATQVMERLSKETALVAPLMGRLQAEDTGPLLEREVALLAEHGQLGEMPPELIEAKGEYTIQYTSPMAKNLHAEEVSAFFRYQEWLTAKAQALSDPGPLDWINEEVAYPQVADYMSVNPMWVRSKDEVDALRNDRAQQKEQEDLLKQAPAMASVATAAMKNGAPLNGG